jgi:hypothetical protein
VSEPAVDAPHRAAGMNGARTADSAREVDGLRQRLRSIRSAIDAAETSKNGAVRPLSHDEATRDLRQDVLALDEFIAAILGSGSADRGLDAAYLTELARDEEFGTALDATHSLVIELSGTAHLLDDDAADVQAAAWAGRLVRNVIVIRRALRRVVDEVSPGLDGEEARRRAVAITGVSESHFAIRDLDLLRAKERQAAGRKGAQHLGHYFDRVALVERWFAEVLRLVTVGALGVLIVLGWQTQGLLESDASPTRLIGHLALTVPLAALVAYLARQGRHHRTAARNAKDLAVRLRTFPLVTADLDRPERNQLTEAVVTAMFTPPVARTGAGRDFGDLTDVVGNIGQALAGLAGSAGEKK